MYLAVLHMWQVLGLMGILDCSSTRFEDVQFTRHGL